MVVRVDRCPGAWLGDTADDLWWLDRAESGQWPHGGGLADQPSRFVATLRAWNLMLSRTREAVRDEHTRAGR